MLLSQLDLYIVTRHWLFIQSDVQYTKYTVLCALIRSAHVELQVFCKLS